MISRTDALKRINELYNINQYKVTYLYKKDNKHNIHVHLKDPPKYCGAGIIYEVNNSGDIKKLDLDFYEVYKLLSHYKSLKILFLDIDGVLNSDDFYNNQRENKKEWEEVTYPLTEFDPKCIERLNRIVEETNAKIVISSDWRFTEGLENILFMAGLKKPIFDTTPYYFGKRDKEIEIWLNNHDVIKYVIVDDNDFFTKEQHEHFIKISYLNGLTEEKAQEIINYFNKN